ncbi:MAG: GNAT family N-acetyltransferase [Mycobacteriales bacterium]
MRNAVIKSANFSELDTETLYKLLQLRIEVFAVEQKSIYQDLDGRDCEPETQHIWAEHEGVPLSVLRVLKGPGDSSQIGRVCTARQARGNGLAARLIELACRENPGDIWLHGQLYLRSWYESFGFITESDEFAIDGIPHIAMRLSRS